MQRIQTMLALCLLFLASVGAYAQSGSGTRVSGRVLEEGTGVPVEFAVVVLSPQELYTTTDRNGYFEFKRVDPGKAVISVEYVGKETIEREVNIAAGRNNEFRFEMKETTFRLEEVTVVATQSKAGKSTASSISRQAMDHMQASSLTDLMAFLPGASLANPSLSSAQQFNIRTAFDGVGGGSSYGTDMNSLGTSIIVDGAPVSANANMQVLSPSISGGVGVTQQGIDSRSISTDNIESVEVIRGVASAEYGDLTSGAVIIHSKAGREPLSIRVKANPYTYQAAASSGFGLGEKGGILNLTADYAYNTTRLYEAYSYYQRLNAKALWSKNFGKRLSTNTSLSFGLQKDTRDLNPDDLRTKLVTKGNEQNVRLATNGTIDINAGWLKTIKYNVTGSYTNKYNYQSELLSNAESLHSAALTDGVILSNQAGKDVYDIDGNKITNFGSADASNWIRVLPYEYTEVYEIFGKELNVYAQLKADFNKAWGRSNNHILLGADFKTDGNLGEGKVYDDATPPMRNNTADYSSYRKRPYYDVPFINQLGAFFEDTYTTTFADRNLNLMAGVRYDNINGKSAISPRFNGSLDLFPRVLTVRGSWGISAKAPTALMLYPEMAYFNINNYDYQDADGNRTTVATVRAFDPTNEKLEIAKQRTAEVGFDLRIADRYRLSVTGFDNLMKNGYGFGSSVDTWRRVPYYRYKAVQNDSGAWLPQLDNEGQPYQIFLHYTTPLNNNWSHNRGIEYELDLGRFDAIRTSFYVNGAYVQSRFKTMSPSFDQNSNGNNIERHVAIYEAGRYTRCKDRFNTAFRITHNIPEIGFVITLLTQVNWMEKMWTESNVADDTVFSQWLSYEDGTIHPYTSS
ncbi:MAG: TonB-dependent receptor, partial [Bacteroidales bacterium]|nr:TonB-dependent receptor [Bacteroidales bacterium]